jgi:pimeloyl-ACP methyl ester carboxylesterase
VSAARLLTRGSADLAEGGPLAYEIHGRLDAALPLLLIRPLGGTMALWGSFREALAEAHPIIAFDLRGSGGSRGERGWPTTRRIATDAVALLDHLGVVRAHVFGISLGGMAATWMGIDAGPRVAKLCIASAPARGLDLTRAGAGRALAMAACFAHATAVAEARLVHRTLSRRYRQHHPEQLQRLESLIRLQPTSHTTLARHAIAGGLHDARDQLHRIVAPCLVLAGAIDELVGAAAQRRLAEGIGDATFDVIAGAGHDITLEQPLASAERVARFLRL